MKISAQFATSLHSGERIAGAWTRMLSYHRDSRAATALTEKQTPHKYVHHATRN
jgi:hypothetical protein